MFIRCPRRLCGNPQEGWSVTQYFRNGLNEYRCHNCRNKFYFNVRTLRTYKWHRKYSTLKYLTFANKNDEVSLYIQANLDKPTRKIGIIPELNPKDCDFIIVLGGDGTMLQAVHSFAEYRKPFIGINLGYRGFLMNPSGEFSFELLRDEGYEVFHAPLLEVEVRDTKGNVFTDFALNDISVHEDTGQSAWLDALIDDEPLGETIRGDGIIVSTPLGSTAYTTNAGGVPVLPTLPVFEITPIAVEPKSRLPIVIPDSSVITIKALQLPKRGVRVSQGSIFRHRDVAEIRIKKSELAAKLIFFKSSGISWNRFFLRRFSEKIFKA